MKRKLLATTFVFLGTILAGCGGGGVYAVRLGPPPPPRYGVVGIAPGPGYVWTDGYWDARGGHWNWVQGRWVRPPRRGSVWVPGEWYQSGHGYRFRRGHWRR
ncbi:MAG TPA: YXWGXW repeat-containing protein [Bryobacteraceae bacterium]|nr:YXWGXW repeat-containing protein [Bryobacteraceae bacterium]